MYYLDRPHLAKIDTEKQWRASEYKRLRKALKLSQEELAVVTGLSFNTVRQMPSVKYDRIPTLIVLERMRARLEGQLKGQMMISVRKPRDRRVNIGVQAKTTVSTLS